MVALARLSPLWVLLFATGAVYGQDDAARVQPNAPAAAASSIMARSQAQTGALQGFAAGDTDALGVPAFGPPAAAGGYRDGDDCPNDAICWQDYGACGSTQWFFYTDLQFCYPPPTTCRRVRCENFPPPGQTITGPIGVISWTGVYIDDASNGCTKPQHLFRIRFYLEDPNTPPPPEIPPPADPLTGYYTENVVAIAEDTGRTAAFASVPATVWKFTAVLTTPITLTTGWFSICGDGTPGCYHLWEGSAEGDDNFYQWFETDFNNTYLHVTDKCDQAYCFGEKQGGACCRDCGGMCIDYSNEVYCASIGGWFAPGQTCSELDPPCGDATGACCHEDGSCTEGMKCCDCEPDHPGCVTYCVGDLNCDGWIDFGDINPFVLYLSNCDAWQAAFPGCPPENGDINCDCTYCFHGGPDFGDINPFVALMTQCTGGCPCPGPIICPPPWPCHGPGGDTWAGVGTTCDDCCTVFVPPGATLENEPNDCAPDTFNGGCHMASPLFSTIACGQTIYGESGNFGQGQRDTDWYRVSVTWPQVFTVTVRAEFDVRIRAYREGPNPAQPCVGYEEVATPAEPAAGTHNKCTDVLLTTRCLPAGLNPGDSAYYFFVVEPVLSSGVPCGAVYKITVECTPCDPCTVSCPEGAYLEGTFYPNPPDPGYCMADPNDLSFDPENGGCNDPNLAFEPLPFDPYDPNCMGICTFTFCGKLWANDGYRDSDWYSIQLPSSSQVAWTVLTEVPCRASLLFSDLGGGSYGPPVNCDQYYYWVQTMVPACVETTWDQPSIIYNAGTYWFFIAPSEGDPTNENPIWTGYPCPMAGVDLGTDYTITMTVGGPPPCDDEILAMPVGHIEDPNDPPCPTPTNWVDTYNSGCDAATPPGPMQTIALNLSGSPIDPNTAWRGRTGTWLSDPNAPNTLQKDYDWYKFTLTQNKRFKVLLFACFTATWEIWDPNDPNAAGMGCAKGPAEGLDLGEPEHVVGEWTRRCYQGGTGGREYWLRVYPSHPTPCGKYYYLALTDATICSPCGFSCTGQNLDDACDDLNDYDTNAGFDDPNGTPPQFMTFNFGMTYCGRIYAGLQNGAPYYDPDWFQITQTNTATKKFKFTLTTEYLAHLEVYASASDYSNGIAIPGLDGYAALTGTTVCPYVTLTSANNYPQGTTVYGRITCVDQLHNLLTKYYPCAKGYNRWKMVPTAVAF